MGTVEPVDWTRPHTQDQGALLLFGNMGFILNLHDKVQQHSACTCGVGRLLCSSRSTGQRSLGIRFTLIFHLPSSLIESVSCSF